MSSMRGVSSISSSSSFPLHPFPLGAHSLVSGLWYCMHSLRLRYQIQEQRYF